MKISLGKFKQFVLYFVLIFAYRIVLDWGYANIVVRYYSYMGYYDNQTLIFVEASYLCLIVGTFVSSYCFNKFESCISSKIIALMYLIVYIPFTSLVRFGHFPWRFILLNMIYWMNILLFNWLINGSRIMFVSFKLKQTGILLKPLFGVAIVFAWFILVGVSWRYANLHMNFSLENVYELRAQAKADSMPRIIRYLFGWARVISLAAIAYYAEKKRYVYVAMSFLALFLSFGYDGSKIILFLAIIVVLINIMPGKHLLQDNKIILLGVVCIVLLGNVLYLISGSYSLASYITRRTLYTPAHLNWAYYDYFFSRTPDFFRGSFLRHFGFSTPYPNIALLIGAEYSNNSSANNGLFGDAYANLGELGVIVMPMLLICFLRILDRCTSELNGVLCLSIALYIAMELADSAFFSCLLSHGLLIIALLLYFINKSNNREKIINTDNVKGAES